jgi:hypothetical protein
VNGHTCTCQQFFTGDQCEDIEVGTNSGTVTVGKFSFVFLTGTFSSTTRITITTTVGAPSNAPLPSGSLLLNNPQVVYRFEASNSLTLPIEVQIEIDGGQISNRFMYRAALTGGTWTIEDDVVRSNGLGRRATTCNAGSVCGTLTGTGGLVAPLRAPDACLSTPCQNGGVCTQDVVTPGFVCTCPASATGEMCETPIVGGTGGSSSGSSSGALIGGIVGGILVLVLVVVIVLYSRHNQRGARTRLNQRVDVPIQKRMSSGGLSGGTRGVQRGDSMLNVKRDRQASVLRANRGLNLVAESRRSSTAEEEHAQEFEMSSLSRMTSYEV